MLARLLLALALALGVLAGPAAADPSFPRLTGRVVDAANVLPDDVEARLTQKLAALEAQSHRQLVVATLPSLQGYDIADYGYQLGRAWGIGDKQRNDGALLIVAPSERKVRIEVGYGLEGVLTDGFSSLIIGQQIVPRFKDGDIPGGVEAGVDAIAAQITLPPDQAQALAAKAGEQDDPAFAIGLISALLVFFGIIFAIIWCASRTAPGRSRRYRSSAGDVAVWSSGSDSSWSSSDSSSDSFSGGGGDFGGGGSSGDW